MTLVAIILGIGALVSQPQPPPQDFVEGATDRSEAVVVEGFVGIQWSCDVVIIDGKAATPSEIAKSQGTTVAETEDEMCYSGVNTVTGEPVTGP